MRHLQSLWPWLEKFDRFIDFCWSWFSGYGLMVIILNWNLGHLDSTECPSYPLYTECLYQFFLLEFLFIIASFRGWLYIQCFFVLLSFLISEWWSNNENSSVIAELNFPFNGSIGGMPNLQVADQCFSFPKNVTLTLTNNQVLVKNFCDRLTTFAALVDDCWIYLVSGVLNAY